MFFRKINKKLDLIIHLLNELKRKDRRIMASIDDVLAGVTELDTQEDSLIALTRNIKALLDAALANQGIPADVQEKIDEVFAKVEANKEQVVAAINENTPAG
jgi:hypothetical protein